MSYLALRRRSAVYTRPLLVFSSTTRESHDIYPHTLPLLHRIFGDCASPTVFPSLACSYNHSSPHLQSSYDIEASSSSLILVAPGIDTRRHGLRLEGAHRGSSSRLSPVSLFIRGYHVCPACVGVSLSRISSCPDLTSSRESGQIVRMSHHQRQPNPRRFLTFHSFKELAMLQRNGNKFRLFYRDYSSVGSNI